MNKVCFCLILTMGTCLLSAQNAKQREYNIKIISVEDSAFYIVLDRVLQSEKGSEYYSPSVSYGIRIFDKEEKKIIKIEVSDNLRLFAESEDLIGCFKYKETNFFVLTEYPELFTLTNKTNLLKIDKFQDIMEDDRWAVYYFGFDNENYYYYETQNYRPSSKYR